MPLDTMPVGLQGVQGVLSKGEALALVEMALPFPTPPFEPHDFFSLNFSSHHFVRVLASSDDLPITLCERSRVWGLSGFLIFL